METFKNRFFEHNFLSFLAENEKFFKQQEIKFTITFLEILKKKNPHLKITSEYKNFIKNMYESLFLSKNFENFFANNALFLQEIKNANIDIEDILNKLFLILSNNFIKKLIKEKNAVTKLKKFVLLLDFYMEYILYHTGEPLFVKSSLPKEIHTYFSQNTKLYLFSVYKGIPIANTTSIISLNEKDGTIEVEANRYQIVASKFQKEIYILEPKTNKTFKAFIEERFPKRKILKLYNIEKINRKTPKRNYIRVQPDEDITVKINYKNQDFNALMYDISLKGTALIVRKKLPCEINDVVKLSFILDTKDFYFFNLDAEVKSITKLTDTLYRYHFYFEPGTKEENALEKYITKREKEIVKELQKFLQKEIKNV